MPILQEVREEVVVPDEYEGVTIIDESDISTTFFPRGILVCIVPMFDLLHPKNGKEIVNAYF